MRALLAPDNPSTRQDFPSGGTFGRRAATQAESASARSGVRTARLSCATAANAVQRVGINRRSPSSVSISSTSSRWRRTTTTSRPHHGCTESVMVVRVQGVRRGLLGLCCCLPEALGRGDGAGSSGLRGAARRGVPPLDGPEGDGVDAARQLGAPREQPTALPGHGRDGPAPRPAGVPPDVVRGRSGGHLGLPRRRTVDARRGSADPDGRQEAARGVANRLQRPLQRDPPPAPRRRTPSPPVSRLLRACTRRPAPAPARSRGVPGRTCR